VYNVTVTGDAAVRGNLRRVRALVPRATAVALVAAAQLVKNLAQGFAPYKTGTLRRSIHVGEAVMAALTASVEVGTNLVYAPAQEYGAHIEPVNGRFLHWVSDSGEDVFARAVDIPPRPYMRPAADQGAAPAVETFGRAFALQLGGMAA
jgi:hypothetical protein